MRKGLQHKDATLITLTIRQSQSCVCEHDKCVKHIVRGQKNPNMISNYVKLMRLRDAEMLKLERAFKGE